MLKAFALSCALGWLLVGCSSESSGACGAISGSYTESETVSSAAAGTCASQAGASGAVTITGAGPDHEVTLPALQGSCPATSNGCSLDVQCAINVSDSSGNPAGSAKLSAHWAFSTTGFTGQSTLVLQQSDGSSCTWTFQDTATKE
jgi:hypothetical protein